MDLTNLTFIDCSSLGVLAEARERARLAGGDVLLAGPRGMVARLRLLTGRDRVFSVFPSVGVSAFSAGLAAIGTRLAADGTRGREPGPAADSNGDGNSQRLLAAADDSA